MRKVEYIGIFTTDSSWSPWAVHGLFLWSPWNTVCGVPMDSPWCPCGLLEMLNVVLLKSIESPQSPQGVCGNVGGSVKYSMIYSNIDHWPVEIYPTVLRAIGPMLQGALKPCTSSTGTDTASQAQWILAECYDWKYFFLMLSDMNWAWWVLPSCFEVVYVVRWYKYR